MYEAFTQGKGAPAALSRWQMAEKFGWTLEYVDSLAMADWHEYLQVVDGTGKANNSLLRKR